MKAGESLLVCETKSLGAAYRLIQEMDASQSAEVIPTTEGALLLVSGEMSSLVNLLTKATDLVSNRLIEKISVRVTESYLGLQNPPLEKRLAIFESRQVGDVFEAALRMEAQGLLPFDLRVLRGGAPRAYVLATGSANAEISTDGIIGQLSLIDDPSSTLKSYFA